MILKRFFIYALLFICISPYIIAEDESYCDESSPSGILVDVESKTLVSISRSFVFVDDRMGIKNASIVAEEGAKNQIVRWFSQEQYTEREVVDSNAIAATTTQLSDSSGKQTSNSVTREMAQTISEFTRSSAEAILQGVQKVEERYDANNLEICVAIATSPRSKELVNEVKDWMSTEKKTSDEDSKESDKKNLDATEESKPSSYHRKRKPL
tara:strand:+ start:221 stop:853 length:633 start_codon:yes stop_codon:yes gene_type:complete